MKKRFNQGMKRTVFSNVHEVKYNPMKKFYGVYQVGDQSFLATYETKFRKEAVEVFEKEAKLAGGVLTTVGAF